MREEKSEAVMAAPEAAEMPAMIARVVFDMVKGDLRLKAPILGCRLPVVYMRSASTRTGSHPSLY